MKFTILVVTNILLLMFMFRNSLKFAPPTRFLIQVYCCYLALEYLVRPVILYYANAQNLRLIFSDLRLVNSQNLLVNSYFLCVLGNFTLVLTIVMIGQKLEKDFTSRSKDNDTEFIKFLIFGLIVGLLSIFIESSNLRNPISKSLTAFGHVTYCLYLWKRPDMLVIPEKLKTFVIHLLGVMNVLALYSPNNSKGSLFAPLIIFVYRSRIWKRQFDILSLAAISLLSIGGLTLFNKLQSRYLGERYTASIVDSVSTLPWYLGWISPIANRFDLFTAVSDAYLAGQGALGGLNEFTKFVADSLLWNPSSGRTDLSYGQLWNQRVTSITNPEARFSPVSLAQGPTADGWIWFGWEGVLLVNLVFAFSLLFLGKLLSSGTTLSMFAMTIVASNVFFEAGIIQLARLCNSGFKVFLVAWCFFILLRLNRKLRYV